MPAFSPNPLLTWIIIAFSSLCIITILVATKGSGLHNSWRLIKADLLLRTLSLIYAGILLVQIINLFFPTP